MMKKASRHFNVSYGTSGGQRALQDNLEEHILPDGKVSFDGFTVWCFVKAYLDKKCDTHALKKICQEMIGCVALSRDTT